MDKLKSIADDIISLKIQGATNVAKEGIKGFAEYLTRLNPSDPEFNDKVNKGYRTILDTRPTEPAMRNGLKKILYDMNEVTHEGNGNVIDVAVKSAKVYADLLKSTTQNIIRNGSQRIQEGYTVMTHCHSSTTSKIFIEAHNQGKNIKAICTETRPRYQGRKTAKELVEAGIPTTMVVDSSMRWILRKESIDTIIIGMDALTSQGTILNKIGSRLLALAAKESDIPFYVAGALLKFDSDTVFGSRTIIEMRDDSEIIKDWDDSPKGLKVFNPAFESVSRDLIDALITEEGVFPPSIAYEIVRNIYPWMMFEYK